MKARPGDRSEGRPVPRVHVEGDEYSALFFMPDGTLRDISGACAIVICVGANYIYQAIKFILEKESKRRRSLKSAPPVPLLFRRVSKRFTMVNDIRAYYAIENKGEVTPKSTPSEKHPVLRTARETQRISVHIPEDAPGGLTGARRATEPSGKLVTERDVLVSWLGEQVEHAPLNSASGPAAPACAIHIQIGLPERLPVSNSDEVFWAPLSLARPRVGRILVVNIGEISETHRIRKSQSYEAIAVDLLRYLRGDSLVPRPPTGGVLSQLAMDGPGAPEWSILAVRINNSAVFLYIFSPGKNAARKNNLSHESAWIICHKEQCAPIENAELGGMIGYTGFVSSHFASVAASMIGCNFGELTQEAVQSVKRSLVWQRVAYEVGCLSMLCQKKDDGKWRPTANYRGLFDEIHAEIQARSRLEEDDVIGIRVNIPRAVAHRTPWFMARSTIAQDHASPSNALVEYEFRKLALHWLSELPDGPIAEPEDGEIPIVAIGNLRLTDRREVEDFLAIHHALKVYSSSSAESKPLNVAVFGAPGAGKSFGVSEVVKHIGKTSKGDFLEGSLQFNLGQFKSLADLPAALHLVRNECLSGRIPVVFFDEFDSAFEGQPFGWLKYLLAPMQDGNFYDNGQTFKIGKAVFIFAGGVNRSFEELNGRMRNPGFCEAKGPDFISRLKAHLNIQGVNKPDDDGDQGRYVLRRAILLHGILRRRLDLRAFEKKRPLLYASVAYALLKIDRFKHGVRSLESIIKMCTLREGKHPIGPSDLPSLEQMEMHVDATKLLREVDAWDWPDFLAEGDRLRRGAKN